MAAVQKLFTSSALTSDGLYVLDSLNTGDARANQPGWYTNFSSDTINTSAHVPSGTVSQMSVCAWIKTSTNDANNRAIVSKYYTVGDARSWQMSLRSTKLRVSLSDDGTFASPHVKVYDSTAAINNNTWRHVGFTFDSGTLKLFIDGAEAAVTKTTDDAITSLYDGGPFTRIGNSLNASSNFAGNIFDARIYSTRILTEAEFTEIASVDGWNAALDSGLVGHWRLDEGSGATTYDSSGNENHAAHPGSSSWLSTAVAPYSFANRAGYSESGAVLIPSLSGSSTLDVLGSALDYTGTAPRNALLVNSNCLAFTKDSNDKIDVANTTDFSGEDWVLSLSMNISTLPTVASTGIIAQEDGGGTGRSWLYIDAADDKLKTFVDGSAQLDQTISAGTDYDIIFTKSGTTFTLSVNGTETTATLTMTSAAGDIIIGNTKAGTGGMGGLIWNIKLDHADGFHFPCAEGAGTTIYDVSSNANHGTSWTGTPTWTTQDDYHYNITYGFSRDSVSSGDIVSGVANQYVVSIPNNKPCFWDGNRYWIFYTQGTTLKCQYGTSLDSMSVTNTDGAGDVGDLSNDGRNYALQFGFVSGTPYAWGSLTSSVNWRIFRWELTSSGLSAPSKTFTVNSGIISSIWKHYGSGDVTKLIYGLEQIDGVSPTREINPDLTGDTAGLSATYANTTSLAEHPPAFKLSDGYVKLFVDQGTGADSKAANVGHCREHVKTNIGDAWGANVTIEGSVSGAAANNGDFTDQNYATNTSHTGQQDVTQLDDGTIYVVYCDNTDTTNGDYGVLKLVSRGNAQASGWTLRSADCIGSSTAAWHVAMTTDGVDLWIFYVKDSGGTRDTKLYCRKYDVSGTAFETEIEIATFSGTFERMSASAKSVGRAVVAWSELNGSTYDAKAASLEIGALVPRRTGTSLDAAGNTLEDPAGNWLNDVETQIDFTGGIAEVPWHTYSYIGADFNGTTGYVNCPSLGYVDNEAHAYYCRARVNAVSAYVWSTRDGANGAISLWINADGEAAVITEATIEWQDVGGTDWTDGEWHDWFLYYNGDEKFSLYVDGVALVTDEAIDPGSWNTAQPFLIGARGNVLPTATIFLDGNVQDMRTWVGEDSPATPPSSFSGEDRHYKLRQNANDGISSEHGTVVGGVTYPVIAYPATYDYGDALPDGITKETDTGIEYNFCSGVVVASAAGTPKLEHMSLLVGMSM